MDVRHEPDRNRFVVHLPSGDAELIYADLGNGVLEFLTTYTPPAERGKGVAAHLVATAVRYAREQGLRIVPSCWYVRDWLAAHPEERDLVSA
ncbi:MAG: N-acetyltransferase [Dehalococcoidia bacterium]|nr:MAG: N-acetyltransferase [Dehalococcoidia bacterium]